MDKYDKLYFPKPLVGLVIILILLSFVAGLDGGIIMGILCPIILIIAAVIALWTRKILLDFYKPG